MSALLAMVKLLAVALGVLVATGAVAANAAEPIYRQTPFDRVTLNSRNNNRVLTVQPIDFAGRQVPSPFPKTGVLRVRLITLPEPPYEVRWSAVVKIELFEHMVLAEAQRLAASGRFEEAFDHYAFLYANYPALAGLQTAFDDFFYLEAGDFHRRGEYVAALARLRDLHQRNPKRAGLENALGQATDRIVESYVSAGDRASALALLAQLAAWYPANAVVAAWYERFETEAKGLAAEARQALDAGRLAEASQLGRQLLAVWPRLPGARELLASIHQRYPRVVVGVEAVPTNSESIAVARWAARRTDRLLYRRLAEFIGPGTEGGRYATPLGRLAVAPLGESVRIDLRDDIRSPSLPRPLTGYDLAEALLAPIDPADPTRQAGLAELIESVSVAAVYGVQLEFRHPHPRPEVLLAMRVKPAGRSGAGGAADSASQWSNGPYVMAARPETTVADKPAEAGASGDAVYLRNAIYFAHEQGSPHEIVERPFARGEDAARALIAGRIDVLDRVAPWQLPRLRADKRLAVERYSVPLVHCLVPNLKRPLVGHRLFRRALVYGIHREAILTQLLAGREEPGCQVVSGPFLAGTSLDDPLDYAYDQRIEPRPYDPRLAIALAAVAQQELAARSDTEIDGDTEAAGAEPASQAVAPTGMPEIVVAHAADEVARIAVAAIARQLKLIGLRVRLVELPGDLPATVPDGVDLLYAPLAMWEPLVDAGRLLGADGMTGDASPYMAAALQRLARATDWPMAGRLLREIHRLCYAETTVVPLWQMTEYFAYRQSVQGIGQAPATLYENVEQWRPGFHWPEADP